MVNRLPDTTGGPGVGEVVNGVVIAHAPFGILLARDETHEHVTIEIHSISDEFEDKLPAKYPPVGTHLTACGIGIGANDHLHASLKASHLDFETWQKNREAMGVNLQVQRWHPQDTSE